MRTINLNLYLIILIILIAAICLLSTSAFVLYQADTESKYEISLSAVSIEKQLELQLTRIETGYDHPEGFPDFSLWKESEHESGLCVRFARLNMNIVKSVCRGGGTSEQWPRWFEILYRWNFKPGQKVVREVTQAGRVYGHVTISPSAEIELGHAWRDVKKLMGLSAVTVVSLCTLLYFAVGWALRPARLIVAGLDKMAEENLSTRLPDFNITEWQRTGQAINNLATNLERTLSDRKVLALKLVNAQEEERRFLTRELHDEFGQSLAGLTAVASSITQTAEKECPKLLLEGQQIERITTHMMDLLRSMLSRLRPADFDQLGLVESLRSMVARWNAQSGGETQYEMEVVGNFDHLPDLIPVNVFRIVQECLTNISKHSGASSAAIKLERITSEPTDRIMLIVEDNGVINDLEFSDKPGLGLLGIRERVTALGGDLNLQASDSGGLIIRIIIPLQEMTAIQS